VHPVHSHPPPHSLRAHRAVRTTHARRMPASATATMSTSTEPWPASPQPASTPPSRTPAPAITQTTPTPTSAGVWGHRAGVGRLAQAQAMSDRLPGDTQSSCFAAGSSCMGSRPSKAAAPAAWLPPLQHIPHICCLASRTQVLRGRPQPPPHRHHPERLPAAGRPGLRGDWHRVAPSGLQLPQAHRRLGAHGP